MHHLRTFLKHYPPAFLILDRLKVPKELHLILVSRLANRFELFLYCRSLCWFCIGLLHPQMYEFRNIISLKLHFIRKCCVNAFIHWIPSSIMHKLS
jgi:hypothetical protein